METKSSQSAALFFLITLLAFSSGTRGETLTFGTYEYCPFICNVEQDGIEGIMVELTREIFEPEGYSVEFQPISSYARALDLVREGKLHGLLPVARENAPSFIFPDTALVAPYEAFFVNRNDSWTYSGLESLESLGDGLIGDVDGASHQEPLGSYLENHPQKVHWISGSNHVARLLGMIKSNRIRTYADVAPVVHFEIEKLKLSGSIAEAGKISPWPMHTAFSPAPNLK